MTEYDSARWFRRRWREERLNLDASLLTAAQKIKIMDHIQGNNFLTKDYAIYTGIASDTICNWIRKRKNGEITRDGANSGRPPYLTIASKNVILDMVTKSTDYCMPEKVFKAKDVALVSEEAVKRGKPLFSAPTELSKKLFQTSIMS